MPKHSMAAAVATVSIGILGFPGLNRSCRFSCCPSHGNFCNQHPSVFQHAQNQQQQIGNINTNSTIAWAFWLFCSAVVSSSYSLCFSKRYRSLVYKRSVLGPLHLQSPHHRGCRFFCNLVHFSRMLRVHFISFRCNPNAWRIGEKVICTYYFL